MTDWINVCEKIALYYKDKSWTYKDLIEEAEAYQPQIITTKGVLICESKNPLDQLFHMLHGLINERPVYFGSKEAAPMIESQRLLKDTFLIATTSGTTGRKKWLYKRKSQWLDSFNAHGDFFGIDGQDILFINGGLNYTANLYSVLQIFHSGGSVVLSSDKNPKKWLLDIVEKKVTVAFLIPSKLGLFLKALPNDWKHVVEITTAGEALTEGTIRRIIEQYPSIKVHHYYGAAEVGHISCIRHEQLIKRPRSVGQAFPGVEIIIDKGLVYAKSPYGASLGKEFESAYDYGSLDGEGYLRILGRQDTQINVHGRKFDANTVVETIKQIDGVEECLFVKINEKNDRYGLYIICSDHQLKAVTQKIERVFLGYVPRWQWPQDYKVVSKVMYSETGKYDMVRIRELFS